MILSHLRNFLIAIYILGVLLISATARGQVTRIDQVEQVNGSLMVKVSGLYSPECADELIPQLMDLNELQDGSDVHVSIGNTDVDFKCVSETQQSLRRFQLAFDLKNLGLKGNETYNLHFIAPGDRPLTIRTFIPDNAVGTHTSTESFHGELIQISRDEYALVDLQTQKVRPLKSTFDLSGFVGEVVQVKVIELEHQLFQTVTPKLLSPLFEARSAADVVSFVVFISSPVSIELEVGERSPKSRPLWN